METKISCLRCHLRISDTAKFCENCGAKVNSPKKRDLPDEKSEVLDETVKTKTNNQGQILILIGLSALCAMTIYYFALRVIVENTGEWSFYETMEPITLIVSGISAGIALMIALGMNSGSRKTVAIIFASIYTVIHLFWLIDRLIPDDSAFQYLTF